MNVDDFFVHISKDIKLDTKKLKLKVKEYQIEFTINIVLRFTHKTSVSSTGEKI